MMNDFCLLSSSSAASFSYFWFFVLVINLCFVLAIEYTRSFLSTLFVSEHFLRPFFFSPT